ncbi:HEAT repeat domain-containing protein [Thermodesulfobacteriota bacterium]
MTSVRATEAMPTLVKMLENMDVYVRAKALGKAGPEAKEAIPVLSEMLEDDAELPRRYAKWALQLINRGGALKELFN